jgi:precorrin-2 dehydrogenase / sirohydrochlorin ferrochelatase
MIALNVSLKQKRIVVVGGGEIAERRVKKILHEEADLFVISPSATKELKYFADTGKLFWVKREFQSDDVKGAFLIIAATNDAELNKRIASLADNNQLTNIVSEFERGNVTFPASEKKGRLAISVTTNGGSPKIASELCEKFINQVNETLIEDLDNQYYQRKIKKRNSN